VESGSLKIVADELEKWKLNLVEHRRSYGTRVSVSQWMIIIHFPIEKGILIT